MLDFNDLFDEQYYLNKNPDVVAAIATGQFSSGLEHFTQFGQREGRDPSAFFDSSFYETLNTDVFLAIEQGAFASGYEHFIQSGQVENRDPTSVFDTGFYLGANPDVVGSVGDQLTAYQHYIQSGQFEAARDPITSFDSSYYLEQNPDVVAEINNGPLRSGYEHFVLFGLAEGRRSAPPDPSDNLTTAVDLGVLAGSLAPISGVLTQQGDPADIYRFTFSDSNNLTLGLDGLSADADLELILDANNNNVVEDGDIFAFSLQFNTTPESIVTGALPAGTYFVRAILRPVSGSLGEQQGDTGYNLTISAG